VSLCIPQESNHQKKGEKIGRKNLKTLETELYPTITSLEDDELDIPDSVRSDK